jgi:mannosyltransferase OCH1-like enzyme
MIPKIIHYCWFGPNEKSELLLKCISSWETYMPDYQIICWNEENSPLEIGYMKNALRNKKWAHLANYTRLHVLYEFGGIYFDTDIEVLKSFNPLLSNSCFVGFEKNNKNEWNTCVNNAVLGAIPKHPAIKQLKANLLKKYIGTEPAVLSGPYLVSAYLFERGLTNYGEQDIESIHIYPLEYFYPYAWNEEFHPSCIKPETFCIHHWQHSWKLQ